MVTVIIKGHYRIINQLKIQVSFCDIALFEEMIYIS